MKGKWQTLYDDAGMIEARQVGPRAFQFIEVTDMLDACGDECKDSPWHVTLSLVDLDAIPPESIASAVRSCRSDSDDVVTDPLWIAEMCHGYGCKAPLWNEGGKNRTNLHRQARSEAHQLLDSSALEDALQRPVNALGSTAAEYAKGDFFSAMQRGAEAGNPAARLVAKMHGVPQDVIDDVRPEDWLPYLMGYMDATNGSPESTEDDLAPTYKRGYERGARVKAGEAPAPGWIKKAG